jgi:hypothetical protein
MPPSFGRRSYRSTNVCRKLFLRFSCFWAKIVVFYPDMATKKTNGRTLVEVFEAEKPFTPEAPVAEVIKACDFQVLSFHDPKAVRADGQVGSEVILIYALGVDGIIREFANGRWTAFPITS